jgi:hypothetical protein
MRADSVLKVPNSNPPNFVNLAPKYLPILVDRVVEFIYIGNYALWSTEKNNESMLIHHATGYPDGICGASYPQPKLIGAKFHMTMCDLTEDLQFTSLYEHAHKKMVDHVTVKFMRPSLADLVDAAFAPKDSELRVCEDKEG